MSTPAVTVVIVSYNTKGPLLRCLASLRDHAGQPLEVRVIDNASADGSPAAVRAAFPGVLVTENAENVGFARANNIGLRAATTPYVLVLNPDARLEPGALPALVAILDARNDVAIVGPKTLSPDGSIQVSFGPDLTPLAEWSQRRLVHGVKARHPQALREAERLAATVREPDWVSGSCFLARREALARISYFDEGFFLYEEDADLCLRVRKEGFRVAFEPRAVVVHELGRAMDTLPARARAEYDRSHLRYYEKHNGPVAALLLRLLLAVKAWRRS